MQQPVAAKEERGNRQWQEPITGSIDETRLLPTLLDDEEPLQRQSVQLPVIERDRQRHNAHHFA
jgi:hypothetical protein